jgi:hypothetical protein
MRTSRSASSARRASSAGGAFALPPQGCLRGTRVPPAPLDDMPPRDAFLLSPCAGVRYTRRPRCGHRTWRRKMPLLLAVAGYRPLVLGKTRPYCASCWLAICRPRRARRRADDDLRTPGPQGRGRCVRGARDGGAPDVAARHTCSEQTRRRPHRPVHRDDHRRTPPRHLTQPRSLDLCGYLQGRPRNRGVW